jgi:predicted DNA binding CopG/RHH family protein
MLHTGTSANASGNSSFEGLLATFAKPEQARSTDGLDELEDDVATLSYERALRSHARYRPPEATDRLIDPSPESSGLSAFEAPPVERVHAEPPDIQTFEELAAVASDLDAAPALSYEVQSHESGPAVLAQEIDEHKSTSATRPIFDRNLKSASITIRLSVAECEQLRTRASEAGLTVSAYLRSCTFEAESLRAMVKDTLSKMRSENSKENVDSASRGFRWFGWLRPGSQGRREFSHASTHFVTPG